MRLSFKELNKQLIHVVKDLKGNSIRVCSVNGTFVRDKAFIGFVQGGHHYVSKDYRFIPKDEIWIEENMNTKDREATILHENHERNNMLYNKLSYNNAHDKANVAEKKFRNQKPQSISEFLAEQLKRL